MVNDISKIPDKPPEEPSPASSLSTVGCGCGMMLAGLVLIGIIAVSFFK